MEDADLKSRARASLTRQNDASECGVACLASLAKYYGGEVSVDALWKESDASMKGTTFQGLVKAASAMGLEAKGYKADIENLSGLDTPCILHIVKNGQQHYVVCYGRVDGNFIIGDPQEGVEETPPVMLAKQWQSKVLLTVEPTEDFLAKVSESEDGTSRLVEEEYQCLSVDSAHFGLNEVLIETVEMEAPRIVPLRLGETLLSLDRFDTLENHAARCARLVSEKQQPGAATEASQSSPGEVLKRNIKQTLRQLAEEKVLTSKTYVREQINALRRKEHEAHERIRSVCIPTAGRPESLRRALRSYADEAAAHSAPVRIVVMDDAENEEETSRQVVERVSEENDRVEFSYADRRRRRAYAGELAQHSGVPPEIVEFALLGNKDFANTYGAPRNTLLLDTVDEVSVQADDDTVASAALLPSQKKGLAFTSQAVAREWWFYEDREELKSSVKPSETRFLEAHEKLLGKTLGQCLLDVKSETESFQVENLGADFLTELQPDSRVVLSFGGVMGDSGRLSKEKRLLPDRFTFQRVVEKYHSYMETREVIRAPTRPTITNGSGCVTMNVGIDNRTTLPPFMPVAQGEDQVFGLCLKLCLRSCYRGYLPHLLLHDPLEDREQNVSAEFKGYGAYALVQQLMLSAAEWLEANGKQAFEELGQHLETIGSRSIPAFSDYVETIARKTLGQGAQFAESIIARRPDAPSNWKEDVRRYIQTSKDAAEAGGLHVPNDIAGGHERRVKILREMTRQYGSLLRQWPTLRSAAADLREQGRPITEQL